MPTTAICKDLYSSVSRLHYHYSRRERKCQVFFERIDNMQAYRCDFCGELFAQPTEIDVSGLIDDKIFRSIMVRIDNGNRVDVCNGCRMVIKDTLEKRIQKIKKKSENAKTSPIHIRSLCWRFSDTGGADYLSCRIKATAVYYLRA